MWLLDHNLPVNIKRFLTEKGIQCETTFERGWQLLTNGHLVEAATKGGFGVILTRDVKFGNAAKESILKYKNVSIVLIRLPQRKGDLYLEAFSKAWDKQKIKPLQGQVTIWP